MIQITCSCGASMQVPEAEINLARACPQCELAINPVSAENLGDGAGTADFDARLVILRGPQRIGEQILLGGCNDIIIGKYLDSHILLPGERVSRRHARLKRIDFGPSRWEILDENSTNGIKVNEQKVKEIELRHNDLVKVGEYLMRYQTDTAGALSEVTENIDAGEDVAMAELAPLAAAAPPPPLPATPAGVMAPPAYTPSAAAPPVPPAYSPPAMAVPGRGTVYNPGAAVTPVKAAPSAAGEIDYGKMALGGLLGLVFGGIGAAFGFFISCIAILDVAVMAGIGSLSGLGVRLGDRSRTTQAGILAVVLTLLIILGMRFGQYKAVNALIDLGESAATEFSKGAEDLQLNLAMMSEELEAQNVTLEEATPEQVQAASDAAESKVQAMTPEEREAKLAELGATSGGTNTAIERLTFADMFTIWSFVGMAFGAASAYKIACG